MPWILPDTTIIQNAISVQIGDTQYPRTIFTKWSNAQLQALGIYPFVDTVYHNKFYNEISYSDNIVGDDVVRTYELSNKFTNLELRLLVVAALRKYIKGLYKNALNELSYLNEFEPTNTTEINLWNTYISDLKTAVITIKSEIQAISSYGEGVEYFYTGWQGGLPTQPE